MVAAGTEHSRILYAFCLRIELALVSTMVLHPAHLLLWTTAGQLNSNGAPSERFGPHLQADPLWIDKRGSLIFANIN